MTRFHHAAVLTTIAVATTLTACSSNNDELLNLEEQLKDTSGVQAISFPDEFDSYFVGCPGVDRESAENIANLKLKKYPKNGPKDDQAVLVLAKADGDITTIKIDKDVADLCAQSYVPEEREPVTEPLLVEPTENGWVRFRPDLEEIAAISSRDEVPAEGDPEAPPAEGAVDPAQPPAPPAPPASGAPASPAPGAPAAPAAPAGQRTN